MGFLAGNQRVEFIGKHNWVETIHRANMARARIMPNSFFNDILLDTDAKGRFKPVPEEIRGSMPLYTGTLGILGAKGKPLGASVECRCSGIGGPKTVIVRPGREHVGLVDTLVTCDHGFGPYGTPTLSLFNAKTDRPIRHNAELAEAAEVLVKISGPARDFRLRSREGSVLESVGGENTYFWGPDLESAGLLGRGHDKRSDPSHSFYAVRHNISLMDVLHYLRALVGAK